MKLYIKLIFACSLLTTLTVEKIYAMHEEAPIHENAPTEHPETDEEREQREHNEEGERLETERAELHKKINDRIDKAAKEGRSELTSDELSLHLQDAKKLDEVNKKIEKHKKKTPGKEDPPVSNQEMADAFKKDFIKNINEKSAEIKKHIEDNEKIMDDARKGTFKSDSEKTKAITNHLKNKIKIHAKLAEGNESFTSLEPHDNDSDEMLNSKKLLSEGFEKHDNLKKISNKIKERSSAKRKEKAGKADKSVKEIIKSKIEEFKKNRLEKEKKNLQKKIDQHNKNIQRSTKNQETYKSREQTYNDLGLKDHAEVYKNLHELEDHLTEASKKARDKLQAKLDKIKSKTEPKSEKEKAMDEVINLNKQMDDIYKEHGDNKEYDELEEKIKKIAKDHNLNEEELEAHAKKVGYKPPY